MTSVLFLCDDNASASILAESILRSVGGPRFGCYSGGVRPAPFVHPLVLDFLRERRLPVSGLRAKSIGELLAADSPRLDFVITLSDLAEEAPTAWGGDPMLAHWNVDGTDEA